MFRVNGAEIGTASPGFYKSTADSFQLGTNATSSYQLNGEIAEIIQYNRALSTIEIQQVEGYLAEKYGITATSAWKSRSNLNLHSSAPQYGSNYFSATAGGKYGLFLYSVDNGRAAGGSYIRATNPDTNPPYTPAYYMDISASDTVPMSKGPSIKGTGVTGFDTASIDNEVTRVIISENTLQHYRSDAPRRRTSIDSEGKILRKDYTVEPRFSQSLHPKGDKGDVDFNTTDHSGDGS